MKLIPVLKPEIEQIKEILNAYLSTFPEEERRSEEQFLQLFSNPNVSINIIIDDDMSIGYVVLWHLEYCVFIEHFEVFEKFRNRKLGSEIIQHLHSLYPQLVLESEPCEMSDIAKRRIDFYQRNGFSIIDKNYIQPSYGEGKNSINLYLLSSLQPTNIKELQKEIHQKVYQFVSFI